MSKVYKINRVNGVNLDVNSPWLQRRNRDDQSQGEGSFREMENLCAQGYPTLTVRRPRGIAGSVTARRGRKEEVPKVSEAAVWEGSSATQSLFYENGVDLSFFYKLRAGLG